MTQKPTFFAITRGDPVSGARVERYEVQVGADDSVLDGLIWLRRHRDASLGFRFACLNANVCKECMMLIDGKTGYACTDRIRPGEIVLQPLPDKPWIRDLVSDIVVPREKASSEDIQPRKRRSIPE